ncbi:MAG: VTT domain-containing protein [Ignavibacteria bacterium]|nr:VTT domain-containing protein [Ignavibacteria bacterium]
MEWIKEFFDYIYDVQNLIRTVGYIGLFGIIFAETGLLAGFFLPGDSLLVTAGLFAAKGDLNIYFLNLLLIPAAVIGDAVGYWIGYKSGPLLFKKEQSFFFRKDYLIKTKNFYDKYGGITIVLARFMPIIRTFAPTVAGIAQMRYIDFFKYNVFGGILWVLSMTLTGYFLGSVIPNIEKHIEKVIVIVVFLSISPAIYKYISYKIKQRKKSTV